MPIGVQECKRRWWQELRGVGYVSRPCVPRPRMVTCELSRVGCCLKRRQQQISTCRSGGDQEVKAYQGPKTTLGAFRKRSKKN